MGRGRKIKIGGQMRDFADLRSLKSVEIAAHEGGSKDIDELRWRYKKNGDVEFFTGDPGADDIVFGGSKSDLRRIEELERNMSVLATKVVTASDPNNYDSDDDAFGQVFDDAVRFKNSAVRFSSSAVVFDGSSTIHFGNRKLAAVDDPTAAQDAATKAYVDAQVSGGSVQLSGLSDTTITSPSSGQVLKYNGSVWINDTDTNTNQLSGLSDTTITSPSTGDFLQYDGSAWINRTTNFLSHGTTITFTVTSASKTSAHRYYGSGSSLGYFIDGVESPFITLTPGRTYRFDQSDASMATHGIRFYQTANKTNVYTTNVTESGVAGQAGAYIEITITDSTPGVLHYQCNNHDYMGNAMQNNTASGDFNTLLNKPTTIAGYGITDSPSVLTDLSITDGSADQVLKTDGAGNFTFTSVSALSGSGIQNVVEDTTPQLGGKLDANGNAIRFANLASDPGSAEEGDVYYNTGDNELKLYADGSWGTLGSGSVQPFLTRQVITHGFVMGGYQSSSPWRNVNTMVHATDVMTNNGDVMPYSGAYTSGACSLTRGYLWSTDNTWPGTSSQTGAFNMTTYASYTGNNMRHGRNDCSTVFKEHEMAWICGGGNGNVDVFNLSNDTMYGSDQGINTLAGDGMQSGVGAHSGETKGYIWQATNDCRRLTFASGTSVTIATPGNAPGINSQQKGFQDKLGFGYAGNEGSYNGGNNLRVWNYTTESYSTVTKPIQNSGEENLDMGQSHQYMMGMYDGAQNNRGWKFTYATNSGSELGAGSVRTGPPGGSSGHCVWRG